MLKSLFPVTSLIMLTMLTMLSSTVSAQKRSVFITAGQSNADGREYISKLPSYLKSGKYSHLRYANVTSKAPSLFGDRELLKGNRYAFQDVCNYWIDKVENKPFYAIKCTYGGTAIALGQTAPKVPVWSAGKEYLDTARAYRGYSPEHSTGDGRWPFKEGNSLAKSFSTGFSALVDGELSKLSDGYEVKAIMWHQGESDRKAAGEYYDNLKTLIAYMRNTIYEKTKDEKALKTPFIMGSICHESTQYSKGVEDAQFKIAAEDPNVYVINMSKSSLRSDHLHFDSLSTEYLGKAMYNVLVKIGAVEGDTIAAGLPYDPNVGKTEEDKGNDEKYKDNDFQVERSWDFTKAWSTESVNAIQADTEGWPARSKWGYRSTQKYNFEELHTSDGYVFPETKGLYFEGGSSRACVNPGNYIGLYAGDITITVPQVKPGQYVIIESETAKSGNARGIAPTAKCKDQLDNIQGGVASTERVTNIWWVQDTFTEPVDATFEVINNGVRIYKILVSEAAPTGVKNVRTAVQQNDSHCYTLSGQLANETDARGVLIKNGKKYIK